MFFRRTLTWLMMLLLLIAPVMSAMAAVHVHAVPAETMAEVMPAHDMMADQSTAHEATNMHDCCDDEEEAQSKASKSCDNACNGGCHMASMSLAVMVSWPLLSTFVSEPPTALTLHDREGMWFDKPLRPPITDLAARWVRV